MKESFDLGKIRELFYEAKASCLSRQNAADIHEKGRCNFVTKADTDMQQFPYLFYHGAVSQKYILRMGK